MGRKTIVLSEVMMSMTGLVVLLAVGLQSVQGWNVTYNDYFCTIRDNDDELVSCTGSGSTLSLRGSLRNNAISSILAGAFDGLSALTTLYLNSNAISSILAGAFDGLSALTTLYLNFNAISSIQADAFAGLSALTTLHLDANPFTSVPCDWGVNTTAITLDVSLSNCVTTSPTASPTSPTAFPTQSAPSANLQSTSREGGDGGVSSTIIIVVLIVVVLVGVTLFFILRDRSQTRQRRTYNQTQPVYHAQRQPIPQIVPPANDPAFTEPEYATMNYDEMGNVVGSNQMYEDPGASARGPHSGNAYGSLMPTYGQATTGVGGRPADAEYTHLDRGGAPAPASLMPVYGQAPSQRTISGPHQRVYEVADEAC